MNQDLKLEFSDSLDYKKTAKIQSRYRYQKVVQNTGAEGVAIGGSNQTTTFEIPAVALSLAHSHLNFQSTHPAEAKFSHIFRNTVPWSRVEVYTRSGTSLMDVTSFAEHFLTVSQRVKTVQDFSTSDNEILSRTALNNLSIKKLSSSADGAEQTIQWRIPFRELYDTVLSLDKTVMFNEVLNLRITWRQASAWGYNSDDAAGGGTTTDLAGDVAIANLALYISAEANPFVVADLTEQVERGTMPSLLIPYSFVYKTNITNQSSHAISTRFSRGHGRMLERVLTRFQNAAETKENRYTADLTATDFTSFYSLLNSRRMTEFDVNVAAADYQWMREQEHAGKVVGLDATNDTSDFAWSDSWCQSDTECARKQQIAGLSLDGAEVKYDLYIQCPAAKTKNYYTIAVTQREMLITPSGIIIN